MVAENASAEKKSPKIISVINYKGGVGKTTLTANVGACLAQHFDKKVLLIDADPQCSLTAYFFTLPNIKAGFGGNNIKSFFEPHLDGKNPPPLSLLVQEPGIRYGRHKRPLYRPRNVSNLRVVPSHLELIDLDIKLSQLAVDSIRHLMGDDKTLKAKEAWEKTFGLLRKELSMEDFGDYDFIFIDCPPNLNIVTQNALFASHAFLMPTKLDALSTLGVEYLHGAVDKCVKNFDNATGAEGDKLIGELHCLGIVPTMTHATANPKDPDAQRARDNEKDALSELFSQFLNKHYADNRKIPVLGSRKRHTGSEAKMEEIGHAFRHSTNHATAVRRQCPLVVMPDANIDFKNKETGPTIVDEIKKFTQLLLEEIELMDDA